MAAAHGTDIVTVHLSDSSEDNCFPVAKGSEEAPILRMETLQSNNLSQTPAFLLLRNRKAVNLLPVRKKPGTAICVAYELWVSLLDSDDLTVFAISSLNGSQGLPQAFPMGK